MARSYIENKLAYDMSYVRAVVRARPHGQAQPEGERKVAELQPMREVAQARQRWQAPEAVREAIELSPLPAFDIRGGPEGRRRLPSACDPSVRGH